MPITLEDTTLAMTLAMFGKKWPYPCREATTPGTRTSTIYLNTYGWKHTPKVAVVCKMWHATVKQQLQLQLRWTAAHIHESAVNRALKMCNFDYYKNHWEFPEIPRETTSLSYLYLDEEQVFSVTFTRIRRVSPLSPAQELLVQYGGPQPGSSPWPVKTIYIPTACWIPRSVDSLISPEQRAESEAWRATQLAALTQWLGEQNASLAAE